MFDEFYKFLEENDALENFKVYYSDLKTFEDFIGDDLPIFYLTFAFTWCNTTQGGDYWYDLNEKWEALVKGNKND